MKKILWGVTVLGFVAAPLMTFAVENNFEIIPEAQPGSNVGGDVTEVGNAGGSVRDKLNQKADKYESK